MGRSLADIAQQLRDTNKKVQLIYAFNGIGKTRLSLEFIHLVTPVINSSDDSELIILAEKTMVYYNALTEDLFYWQNSPEEPKLKIQPNNFTEWILKVQGQDRNIIANFQNYTNTRILPKFSEDFSEVTFSLANSSGSFENIKISKGEESNFVWSIFYTQLDQVINILNVDEPSERETNQFNQLQYVFIDDPVSSLDDNHLIELAVNLAKIIRESKQLKFIISTHNPLFFNVLYNELKNIICYMLDRQEDGTFELIEKKGDSNTSFSYHLFLKNTLEEAVKQNNIQKYHFTLLRNLYEKTANFLGYPRWSELLPDDKQAYLNRIIQFTSHSTLSNEVIVEPTEPEKQIIKFLLSHLIHNYNYWQDVT